MSDNLTDKTVRQSKDKYGNKKIRNNMKLLTKLILMINYKQAEV